MPNAPKAGTVQITMRISEELAARAEAAAEKLRRENPGIPIARTDAMRMVLELHLPPLEAGQRDNQLDNQLGPGTNRPPSQKVKRGAR